MTYRFAARHLDGDPRRGRFLGWMGFAVVMAYTLMLATNLALLFVAWLLVSLCLHELLTFYPDRYEALAPARKKFLISRLGDFALIGAIVAVRAGWGTTDLHVFPSPGVAG